MNNIFLMNLNTPDFHPNTHVNNFEDRVITTMVNDGFEERILDTKNYRQSSVRWVISNGRNQIAIIYSSKENYYKLPGGWIEDGEKNEIAMKREWKEETGADIIVGQYIWTIEEQSKSGKVIQYNRWYLAEVIWDVWEVELTAEEIERKFELLRLTLDEAIDVFTKNSPMTYRWNFMQTRDLRFLQEAKKFYIS